MFTHGAMCSAYSGNCIISNFTAGRDSNRGGCKQSCRFHYKISDSDKTYPLMSSKDLSGIFMIKHFTDHRIDSLKIEGRMKSNLYVAATCKSYRNLIDSHNDQNTHFFKQDQALEDINTYSNRGYTTGFIT